MCWLLCGLRVFLLSFAHWVQSEADESSLSGWLNKIFGRRTAARARRDNPVMQATVRKSSEIYQQTPLARLLDNETREQLSRSLFLEINDVCNAIDPVAACRDKLASAMLDFAAYQVLLIPPLPEADSSGLRMQPGITGELKQEIVRIAKGNFKLRSELFGLLDQPDPDAILDAIERSYWKAYWLLETINAARIELGDVTEDGDWYASFMHAACASCEGNYRREAGLPSAFHEAIASAAPTAYGIYTDIVLSGAKDPDAEWRDYHSGSEIPTPSHG